MTEKKILTSLNLGATKRGPFNLESKILQRHLGCFGSSGSGKTVACKVLIEELAMIGIPVIAFDPQGDIASLAIPESEEFLKKKKIDLKKIKSYAENVEVVVWTPAIDKGLPICINPLQFNDMDEMTSHEKTRIFSVTSKNIISLIGYNLEKDEGKIAEAVLETIFLDANSNNIKLDNFSAVTKILKNLPKNIAKTINGIASNKFLQTLIKKLNLLNVGARKLVFQNGTPANINTLLGKDNSSSKTRISIIYLNTLHTASEKEFFIASIAQELYRWMLKNPLSKGQDGIQCSLFLDEIAPYIPPVRKPACKESLDLIFRQGRKYGVSCIVATQSPGDIDYKAIGQFSSFALGTLNTKQDIEKVKRRLESITPTEIDSIIKKLPALQPGEFLFISPDAFDSVQEINVRWLLSKHTVISEDKLPGLISDSLREQYESIPGESKKSLLKNTLKDNGGDKKSKSIDKQFFDINKSIGESKHEDGDKELEPVEDILPKKVNEQSNDESGDEKLEYSEETLPKKANEESIFYMKNKIFERQLLGLVKPFLLGSIFKKESLKGVTFNYLPLIKVSLTSFSKEGFFIKKTKKIKENLYLSYKNHEIFYLKNKIFQTSSIIDKDPHKIVDLDNIGKIEMINKNKLDYDFRQFEGKSINQKKISTMMERKYNVKVHESSLILFPVWECTLSLKKEQKTRKIVLDAILGNEVRFD